MGLHQVIILDFGKGPEPQRSQQGAIDAMKDRRPNNVLCAYRDPRGGLHYAVPREVNGSRSPEQVLMSAIECSRELASKAARRGGVAVPQQTAVPYRSTAKSGRALHGLW